MYAMLPLGLTRHTFEAVDIPVSFEYEGIQFDGVLSQVAGAGNTAMYHLYINGNMYYGQLWYNGDNWQFGSNTDIFSEQYMVDFFVDQIQMAQKL